LEGTTKRHIITYLGCFYTPFNISTFLLLKSTEPEIMFHQKYRRFCT